MMYGYWIVTWDQSNFELWVKYCLNTWLVGDIK